MICFFRRSRMPARCNMKRCQNLSLFVENLKKIIPYYDIRHDMRPGITGWAQVCYPYGASEEDALHKLEYDLYYMKHLSAFLDFLVMFKTLKIVLFAKGGR